ncbi:MAG: DUF4338 domain-containing protein [Mariprofundales bacterium]|nr:DUF4338 domain-containing protein [Mariprofundales bacterium]
MQINAPQETPNLQSIIVRPVARSEESDFKNLMQTHHYLGALPKIGETVWYIATLHSKWIALLSFSSPALKCAVRDQWIGWSYRHQYDRLHLVTNNTRFLILPDWHYPNVASRILSLCQRRLAADWQNTFNHPLLLLETFVDPSRFKGTIYKAANWQFLGHSKGFKRIQGSYSKGNESPKMVFAYSLQRDAQRLMSQPILNKKYQYGRTKIMLPVRYMQALPDFFIGMTDPRRGQGRRHSLPTVLSIAVAATLCGAKGYKGISDWANSLGQKALVNFRCRKENGKRVAPSLSIIRNVMIGVDPDDLDAALQRWTEIYSKKDESLAIDGKTMRGAVAENGR